MLKDCANHAQKRPVVYDKYTIRFNYIGKVTFYRSLVLL